MTFLVFTFGIGLLFMMVDCCALCVGGDGDVDVGVDVGGATDCVEVGADSDSMNRIVWRICRNDRRGELVMINLMC